MFTSGTSLVTQYHEFKRFNNCIQAFWQKLQYPAMKIEINVKCIYSNGEIYFTVKIILPPNETSFTFTGLQPGSQCEFILKAVYNPASLDNGISVSYMVLPARKTFLELIY